MLRSSLYAIGIRTLCVLCFFLPFATLLHAQPATVWSYKGSVLTLSQTDANVVITYQTLSDALMKSGAHVGDPLFRGQRVGNSLKGRAYRFFGPQCQPMGFGVEGSIEVPPLSWTPKHLCFRSPRCRRNAPHTRLSFGGR